MTLSAKSSLFLGENKAGFRRESHFNGASYSSQNSLFQAGCLKGCTHSATKAFDAF